MLDAHTTPPTTPAARPQGLPLHEALLGLCGAVIPVWRRHLDTAQDHAELAVSEMLAAFAEIHPALSDNPQLKQQAERMLVGLQYQDRISQMMALLALDMQRLQDALAEPVTDLEGVSSQAWLARLESGYAMQAQRHAHHEADGPTDAGASRPDADTDFF